MRKHQQFQHTIFAREKMRTLKEFKAKSHSYDDDEFEINLIDHPVDHPGK